MGRRSRRAAFWGVVLLVLAGGQVWAVTPSLCDYTPLTSRFLDLRFSGDFRLEQNPAALHSLVYDGTLELSGVYLADTQTQGMTLEGDFSLNLADPLQNRLRVLPNLKFFQGGGDFFTFFGLNLDERLTRSLWEGGSMLLGYGYGRFRDVTAFARAVNLQNRLLQLGRLSEPLPDETLIHLAALIHRQGEPNLPLSTLIGQIAETLEASNLIRGRLGPSSLLAIEEVLQDKGASKFCGWETQLAFSVGLGGPGEARSLALRGAWAFRYALAPAPRSQLLLSSRWTYSFLSPFQDFFLSASADYSYRWREAVEVRGSYTFSRSRSPELPPLDVQALNLALIFQERALSLTLDLKFSLSTGAPAWNRTLQLTANYELF